VLNLEVDVAILPSPFSTSSPRFGALKAEWAGPILLGVWFEPKIAPPNIWYSLPPIHKKCR
jgi:hypothetical protein